MPKVDVTKFVHIPADAHVPKEGVPWEMAFKGWQAEDKGVPLKTLEFVWENMTAPPAFSREAHEAFMGGNGAFFGLKHLAELRVRFIREIQDSSDSQERPHFLNHIENKFQHLRESAQAAEDVAKAKAEVAKEFWDEIDV